MSRELLVFDMDEVFFPMLENFLLHYNPKYGTEHKFDDFSSYDFEHTLGLPIDETVRRVYDYLATDHSHIEAIEGSQEGMDKIAEYYDFAVATARHEQFEESTINFLHSRYGNVFKEVVLLGYHVIQEKPKPKAQVCAELGALALIDDSGHHISLCPDFGIEGHLFGLYPWNKEVKLVPGTMRQPNWPIMGDYFYERAKRRL